MYVLDKWRSHSPNSTEALPSIRRVPRFRQPTQPFDSDWLALVLSYIIGKRDAIRSVDLDRFCKIQHDP
ncbi:hypothetical protein CKA32_005406 [Geitlerinema sp. FC II]|nr:hypothetical protein CKA32_005406 [Geitlerinema sp. FC II]